MVKGIKNSKWRYAVWGALAFTALTFVAVFLCYCFICRPLDAYWLSYDFGYDKQYTCVDGNVLSPFVGILSMTSDIYTVVLPCVMLQHFELSIPRRQKIGLNIVFALGSMYVCWKAPSYVMLTLRTELPAVVLQGRIIYGRSITRMFNPYWNAQKSKLLVPRLSIMTFVQKRNTVRTSTY